MSDIMLLMCYHKLYNTVPPMWIPIQCGAAINTPVAGTITDSDGDNISEKNREYCELTAHYYAWKNVIAEYYGFCHYRRFFCADDKIKRPYLAKSKLTESTCQRLLRDDEYWRSIIAAHDIIVPRSEDMGITAREHYITSKFHFSEDMELFLEILSDKAPQMTEAAVEYLAQDRQYFCNMFIMKAKYFHNYCEVLFDVLEEFDTRKTLHGDFQSDRTDGYLGEIFTGIYITHCRKNGADIVELPRIDLECSLKKRLGCAIFPPESKRRFLIKKLVKKFRGD